ncbi:MAG TPA: hypothetical protein VFW92_10860 [Candidatus Limnocylindrales bacterium]|nr:hypothetical protein [Candidatus Limnocylindrales bacterium]
MSWIPRPTAPTAAPRAGLGTPLLLSPAGLAAFVLAQLSDLVTFLFMIELRGTGAEANPIVATFLDLHHLGLLILAKIAAWAVALSCAALLSRRTPRLAEFVVGFGILVGLIGALSNLLAL